MSKGTIGTSMVVFTPNKEKRPTLNELKAKLNKTKDPKEKKKLANKVRNIKKKIISSRKKVQKYTTTCDTFYPDRAKQKTNEQDTSKEL